jgi:GT2 family glycosyltransferase
MTVYAITLAFCNPEIISRSIAQFYATKNPSLEIEKHMIVDQHYPLDYPSVKKKLHELEKNYPVIVVDPGKNLGLHGGFNWALTQLKPGPDDIIIGYDGDSYPISSGWDMALTRAILSPRSDGHGQVVWSTLGNTRSISDARLRGYDRVMADGFIELMLVHAAVTNSICAWRYDWLESVGFLDEPLDFYGHLETCMWQKLQKGKRWAVLTQWMESDELRDLHDRQYVAYKWFYAHDKTWTGDLASYIEAGCPDLAKSPPRIP